MKSNDLKRPWFTHLWGHVQCSFQIFYLGALLLRGPCFPFFSFFLLAPNRLFCSSLFCLIGWQLKAQFAYSGREHTEPAVETLECSSQTDSRQSLKCYRSWLWLISQRQGEPQEAKCSALARPFWFAVDVWLFDVLSFGCAAFIFTQQTLEQRKPEKHAGGHFIALPLQDPQCVFSLLLTWPE